MMRAPAPCSGLTKPPSPGVMTRDIKKVRMTLFLALLAFLAACALWTRILSRQAVAALPPPGAFQAVPGGNIHFVESGPPDAPTLVLIHGLAGNLHHFTYAMLPLLADRFHVIAPDRPGSGYSTRNTDRAAHLETQAAMLWDFLDARGVTRPILVGHSLGGAVALAMALARPQGARALALLSPATQPQSATPDVFRPLQLRLPLLRRCLAHTLVVPATRLTRTRMLREIFAPDPVPPDFHTKGGGLLAFRPETFISASADLMETRANVGALTARYATDLHTPGGVLFAAGDAILSPAHHGTPMAQFGLPMQLLPGHGHMIPLTAPRDCVAFITRVADTTPP